MRAKGIIFDLDGTLIDSMPMWENIGDRFLEYIGKTPREGLRETLKPLSFNQSAQYFIDEYGVALKVEEIIAHITRMVSDEYKHKIKLKPFVYEAIKKLKHDGIAMCIATATDFELATAALERLGILDCFDFVLTCDIVGYGKDSPLIYQEAARRLGIPKSDILVFEDMLFCAQVAKNAGFNVIGVYDDISQKDMAELKRVCDVFIMSFKEVV